MPSFLKSHRGLSGLEYMAIIVVVMTGILLGGPYVMRAINAPFRSIEEGAMDSAREDIKQGDSIGGPPPVCDCLPLSPAGCGDGTGGCDQTKALWKTTCSPLGCEVDLIKYGVIKEMQKCMDDPTNTCCLDPVPTGNCGALAKHVVCAAGEMEVKKMCGSPVPTPVYACSPDPSCLNGCQPFGSHVKGWCDSDYNNGVIGSQPPRVVKNGHCNDDSDMRCKAECTDDSYPSGSVCLPYCGNGTCEDGTSGKPNYGENPEKCPADCSVTARWYNKPPSSRAMSCPDFCKAQGLYANRDPSGEHCASGEDRPLSDVGRTIDYWNGCWHGCTPNNHEGLTREQALCWDYTCYGVGQKADNDGTDVVVACYCGPNPNPDPIIDTPSQPVCGDEICDGWCEDYYSCDKDCKVPPPPPDPDPCPPSCGA